MWNHCAVPFSLPGNGIFVLPIALFYLINMKKGCLVEPIRPFSMHAPTHSTEQCVMVITRQRYSLRKVCDKVIAIHMTHSYDKMCIVHSCGTQLWLLFNRTCSYDKVVIK